MTYSIYMYTRSTKKVWYGSKVFLIESAVLNLCKYCWNIATHKTCYVLNANNESMCTLTLFVYCQLGMRHDYLTQHNQGNFGNFPD